jgi:integrase
MLLSLAVLTGARRGELCATRWTDAEGDTIRIRRSIYRAGTDRGEKSSKGGRERWVVLAPAGRTLLEAWRSRCTEIDPAVDVNLAPDAFVVSSVPDGSPRVNPETSSSVVHKLREELKERSDSTSGAGCRTVTHGSHIFFA